MSNVTFRRGQVEWALWRAFTHTRSPGDGPPPVFKTRIKRLLDLDRDIDVSAFGAEPPCAFAFVEPSEGGSGTEAQYAAFDALCLALALDLLDVGFKQGEIVYLMRHLRESLEEWFPDLLSRPSLIDRQRHLAQMYPKLPRLERAGGKTALADARVFLILNRIEMTEVLAPGRPPSQANPAVFLEPVFCEGIAELQSRLDRLMPRHRRTVITLEITAIAQAVSTFLEAAPIVPRGRPRRSN
jgi:hypothetical protein